MAGDKALHIDTYLHEMPEPAAVRRIMVHADAILKNPLEGDFRKRYWERCMMSYHFGGSELVVTRRTDQGLGIVVAGEGDEVAGIIGTINPEEQKKFAVIPNIELLDAIEEELNRGEVACPVDIHVVDARPSVSRGRKLFNPLHS